MGACYQGLGAEQRMEVECALSKGKCHSPLTGSLQEGPLWDLLDPSPHLPPIATREKSEEPGKLELDRENPGGR